MKTALITGAATGIGRAIATELARDHNIAFTWHKTAPDALMNDLPSAFGIQCDLTDPEAPHMIIDNTLKAFGSIDVIVNNAGVIDMSPLETHDRAKDHAMFDVHVSAPAAILAAALPHLTSGASIVNISSINARLPPKGAAIYGASKAAQDLWTRAMAKELGHQGVRINAVAPGAVNTDENPRDPDLTQAFLDLTALPDLTTTQDIANAVRFLSSDAAKSITGQILNVCGGYRL